MGFNLNPFDGFGLPDVIDDTLSGPDLPDPYKTADAQSQANLDAILASAGVNQMGINAPGFGINYTGEIGGPDRMMHMTLSPERQALADSIYGAVNSGEFMPNYSAVPGLPGSGDYSADAMHSEDAMYDALMSRLSPVMDRNQRRLDTQLATTGIPVGSDAYHDVQSQFGRDRFDQELAIANQAVQSGRSEQSRLFGLDLATHQQGMSDVGQRTGTLAQLLALDPTQASPPSQPAYQMQPPDIAGLIQGNYNAQLGQNNAMMGGLSSLGAAAILASDRRLKHNIKPRGTLPSGIPLYEYSYLGSDVRCTGVMAQDVLEIHPDAVVQMDNGYLAVDYGKLL